MKCPCCNSEMSAGVVQSAREIFFTTEANQNWLNPFLANKNKIMLSTNNFSRPARHIYVKIANKLSSTTLLMPNNSKFMEVFHHGS